MGRTNSTEKLAAVVLGLLAVLSPLYIDRKPEIEEDEDEDEGSGVLALWLPLLLIFLIVAINFSCLSDKGYLRFDPYWIHRVGGSSCGIIICLLVIGFVLKCKASM